MWPSVVHECQCVHASSKSSSSGGPQLHPTIRSHTVAHRRGKPSDPSSNLLGLISGSEDACLSSRRKAPSMFTLGMVGSCIDWASSASSLDFETRPVNLLRTKRLCDCATRHTRAGNGSLFPERGPPCSCSQGARTHYGAGLV